MKQAQITLLPGDGIGPEVIESAVTVLQTLTKGSQLQLEFREGWIGGAALDRFGVPLDSDSLAACKKSQAVLLGAVGGPKWEGLPGHLRPEAGLLQLRRELGVFANLRPVKARTALYDRTPYRADILRDVDIMVVRELTGGIYFGDKAREGDSAYDVCRYQRSEIERIARVGAQQARLRRGKLTSIDKANVLETSRLWREVLSAVVIQEFPELQLEHILVDAAAMYLAQRPQSFDVIVTENMFGDILSDQASTLAGSLGLLPSASLGLDGPGLYEPVHGSAPTLAGQSLANPIGAILSAAMLLRLSLEEPALADRLDAAVEELLELGPWTADLAAGSSGCSTQDVTRRLCAILTK